MALPLVIVIIVLASTIVVGVTYSTYMSGRLNASLEQALKGEYLVKSALNLARILIQADVTEEDSSKDTWALFRYGQTIPLSLLGIDEPNVKVELEISSLGAKLPLRCLAPTVNTPTPLYWLESFKRLFINLGFDDDDEVDQSGKFGDRVFNSSELVANLVDYVDKDSESFSSFGYSGIESELPAGVFRNDNISRETEIASIPGFTPARLQRLLKYVSTATSCQINVNSASEEIFKALDIQPAQIEIIKAFRTSEDGPYRNVSEFNEVISPSLAQSLTGHLSVRSTRYIVLAKAQFLASVTYLKAGLETTSGDRGSLPKITSLELY